VRHKANYTVDLFDKPIAYAAHSLSIEMILLAMLIEQNKEMLRLKANMEQAPGCPTKLQPKEAGELF